MPKKIYKSLLFTMVVATIALFAVTPAVVQGAQCNSRLPDRDCFGSFTDFAIDNDCGYFNADSAGVFCEPIEVFDFAGTWEITAIATEAANALDATWSGSSTVTFDTEVCSNWGMFQEINFSESNLVFTDNTVQYSADLNPFFFEEGCGDFQVCRLTQDSNQLSYLDNPVTLRAGSYIIGFNNTGADCDYQDLIVAASSPEVCEAPRYGQVSTNAGCASIMEVDAGTVYMSYQRVGDCEVDEEGILFYLNSDNCTATTECDEDTAPGDSCVYPEPVTIGCYPEGCNEETGDGCPAICIEEAVVGAILCMQPDSPCQECMRVDSGSPTCVNYTTVSGSRIQVCIRQDGVTCPFFYCCVRKIPNVSICGP